MKVIAMLTVFHQISQFLTFYKLQTTFYGCPMNDLPKYESQSIDIRSLKRFKLVPIKGTVEDLWGHVAQGTSTTILGNFYRILVLLVLDGQT